MCIRDSINAEYGQLFWKRKDKSQVRMILLSNANPIIENTMKRLTRPFKGKRREQIKIDICDFDQCTFQLACDPKARNMITLALGWSLYSDSVMNGRGLEDRLKKIYGSWVTSPPAGFDFAIQIDLDNLPAPAPEIVEKFSLLKRNVFSVPFLDVFEKTAGGSPPSGVVAIPYRTGEAVYLKASGDRVTAIFAITFNDLDDIIYSKIFLTEFMDVKKTIRAAPAVLYSHATPPLELNGVRGAEGGPNQGFVNFALFKGYIQPDRAQKTVDIITLFRNYLQYHIKCSKAYMHTRMRNRVKQLLLILNRAKVVKKTEKKTASGRTFTRK
eukprot:TRINITY_DN138_c0_g2_i1.p1 TRINITY_DN138_c0_g2~~TRINITY_DN138_c0_g2_i1.p1  ORF type:complete len:327 (-),score=52.26 TRINITY_DN138_c0_g2_i1:39-1019(-)